jgi:hypothetical protein
VSASQAQLGSSTELLEALAAASAERRESSLYLDRAARQVCDQPHHASQLSQTQAHVWRPLASRVARDQDALMLALKPSPDRLAEPRTFDEPASSVCPEADLSVRVEIRVWYP